MYVRTNATAARLCCLAYISARVNSLSNDVGFFFLVFFFFLLSCRSYPRGSVRIRLRVWERSRGQVIAVAAAFASDNRSSTRRAFVMRWTDCEISWWETATPAVVIVAVALASDERRWERKWKTAKIKETSDFCLARRPFPNTCVTLRARRKYTDPVPRGLSSR